MLKTSWQKEHDLNLQLRISSSSIQERGLCVVSVGLPEEFTTKWRHIAIFVFYWAQMVSPAEMRLITAERTEKQQRLNLQTLQCTFCLCSHFPHIYIGLQRDTVPPPPFPLSLKFQSLSAVMFLLVNFAAHRSDSGRVVSWNIYLVKLAAAKVGTRSYCDH